MKGHLFSGWHERKRTEYIFRTEQTPSDRIHKSSPGSREASFCSSLGGSPLQTSLLPLCGASTDKRKRYEKLLRCCFVLQPPEDSEKWEADVNQHVGASWKNVLKFNGEETYSKRSCEETPTTGELTDYHIVLLTQCSTHSIPGLNLHCTELFLSPCSWHQYHRHLLFY